MTLTADNIDGYARTLVLQAAAGGVILDFSPDSITHLEALISGSDPALAQPDFPDDQRNLLVFYVGCYLGEALARHLSGVWQFAPSWWDSTLTFACADGRGVQIQPFSKVRRRVLEPEANDLPSYVAELTSLVAGSAQP